MIMKVEQEQRQERHKSNSNIYSNILYMYMTECDGCEG
jgi:hypothetical protein